MPACNGPCHRTIRAYAEHRAVKTFSCPAKHFQFFTVKPGTHWRQNWIQHGRLCWKSTESTVSLWSDTHWRQSIDSIGNKVDRVGDNVDRDKLSHSSCCRFVAGFDNSRLCRQCVPGFTGELLHINSLEGATTLFHNADGITWCKVTIWCVLMCEIFVSLNCEFVILTK